MPVPLEYMDLTERAILWIVSRIDREGFPLVASPVEICVRWEEGQQEMLRPDGEKDVTDVTIATNRNIPLGSIIWEGSEEDLEDAVGTSLIPESDVYEVVTRNRGKDILGTVTRYEFGIKRYKDTLPRVVA